MSVMQYAQHLVCPICASQLVHTAGTLSCTQAHAFDVAREGYVNVLRKKVIGDTKEMLLARRNVFAQGHYLPVSDALNEMIAAHLSDRAVQHDPASPCAILDAGCGEGYYLNRLQAYLAVRQLPTTCLGLDVSKEAVRLAARGCSEAFFLVANLKERLAFADSSFQVIMNIFAPRNPLEFARVLAPGGLLLVVIPAPAHLQQLRAALHLLSIEEHKQQHVVEQFTAQGLFQLEATRAVEYELCLRGDEISQLVTMTPNYWHFTDEMRRAASDLSEIRTEIACLCLTFRRSACQ